MTIVVLAGLGFGWGVVGVVRHARRSTPDLRSILAPLADGERATSRPGARPVRPRSWRIDQELGIVAANFARRRSILAKLDPQLAICGISLDDVCSRLVLSLVIGGMAPGLILAVVRFEHVEASPVLVVMMTIGGGTLGCVATLSRLRGDVKRRYAHARRVVCSFIDLVSLGLAGGMGIESALLAAAELGDSDLSQTLFGALCSARDGGRTPWSAIEGVGTELGITELKEIATAAAIAGTEGARIRSTLSARVASIRRHELAREEAAANATSERLFLPGILLLLGFLIFVGFPAFARITAGL